MRFPLKSGAEWEADGDLLRLLSGAYPRLNVLGELEKARAWLTVNPSRRKTARGMPRFLKTWMARALAALPPPPPARRVVVGQNADGSPRYG